MDTSARPLWCTTGQQSIHTTMKCSCHISQTSAQLFRYIWTLFIIASRSQSVFHRYQGIHEQCPGDPWKHFYDCYFAVYLFKKKKVLLKISSEIFNWWYVYVLWLLEYLIKKLSAPTKRATVSLIMGKSCNVLLHMLLVCISSYKKSVQIYKFLILDTPHQDTVYLLQQSCDDPWLIFEA
jgi:hypothetical protein